MTVIMRKYLRRLFNPKGLDNLLCGEPWSFFADSDAHQVGPGVEGD